MSRKLKQRSDPATQLDELRSLLSEFSKELDNPDLRYKVRALIPSFTRLRSLGVSLMSEQSASTARDRILAYLRRYPRTIIDGDELMVVSGIGEWARRVRELRVQFGWLINSGSTFKDMASSAEGADNIASLRTVLGTNPLSLKPTQYVLVSDFQDREAAHRWNVLNEIRKTSGSVQDKILRFLRANVGKPVTGEELRYLAKDRSEWARRVRELRTEEGWPVVSRMSGRADLPIGVYVLETDDQAPEHDRHIPDAVRVTVLERDQFKCRVCGWDRSMLTPSDPRKFLELHHRVPHREKGENVERNLITLCNVHHDEVHRSKVANERVLAIVL